MSHPLVPRPCTVGGCEDVIFCHEYCVLHYFRWKRHGNASAMPKKYKPSSRRKAVQLQ